MTFLRSLIFYLFFYTWTVCFFLLFSPVKYFNYKFVVSLSTFWTSSVIKLAQIILRINFEIIGLKNIPKSGSFIVASNHQAAWETFFFGSLFPGSVFILKDELRKIPIFSNYFLKLGFIFVKRNKSFDSLKIVLKSIRKLILEKKKVFIIFPEGTRLKPNEKGQLNTGVFAIHKFLSLPILPIKLNSGEFWINKKFLKKRGTIRIKIFPLIKKETNKEKVMKTLERYY